MTCNSHADSLNPVKTAQLALPPDAEGVRSYRHPNGCHPKEGCTSPAGPAAVRHLRTLLQMLADMHGRSRAWQTTALRHAVEDELRHGAVSQPDPLTKALYRQLDCCAAEEGARPPGSTTSALTPEQWKALAGAHQEWRWLPAAALAVALLAAVLSTLWPWGFAA